MPYFVFISKLGTAAGSSRGLSIFPKMQNHNHRLFFFIFSPVRIFCGTDTLFTACNTAGRHAEAGRSLLLKTILHLMLF